MKLPIQQRRINSSEYPVLDERPNRWHRAIRQAGAVLLCTFLLFLWNKARAGDENPLSMVKIEGNCRLIPIVEYILEGDVESYTKRPSPRFDLLQFSCTQERRDDWTPAHWLTGFYFTVDIGRNKQGIYWRVRCQSDATIFGADDRAYVVISQCPCRYSRGRN